jgi:GNAT superfamily N-acetyltransferase
VGNVIYTLRTAASHELDHAIAIDDAAGFLFGQAGLSIDLSSDHPFVVAERARWRSALAQGQLWFACQEGQPVGFSALGRAGELAYLEQLAVRPEHGRRGVGTMLLAAACEQAKQSGDSALWLTTYAHLAWNRPYYERQGFSVVPESHCSPELQAHLAEQRATLPAPEERVAMMRKLR